MKNQLTASLSLALMISGGAQAACTVGGHPVGPQPPLPVTTAWEPEIVGEAPWAVVWITNHNQTPNGVYRELSNPRDLVPASLAGSNTTPAPPPPPPPPNGGGNRCDSVLAVVTPREAERSSYIERTPIGPGLYRHLLELDLKYIVGGIDLRSGAAMHFPLVAWHIPMNNPDVAVAIADEDRSGVVLRVDYVGLQEKQEILGEDTDAKYGLSVYWNNTLVRTYALQTESPRIELKWSSTGEMLLNLDVGANPSTVVRSLPLLSSVMANFQPTSFQVGRVPMPDQFVPAYGEYYAYSHLIEAPALTGVPR